MSQSNIIFRYYTKEGPLISNLKLLFKLIELLANKCVSDKNEILLNGQEFDQFKK